MKTLDQSRYYKIVGLNPASAWAAHPGTSIMGTIVRPESPTNDLPRLHSDGLWHGWFKIKKPSQWKWPGVDEDIFICGVKLHLVPPNQQEKIDAESRLNAA